MEEQIKNLKTELCDIMINERNCQAQLNVLARMEQQKMIELQKLLQEEEKRRAEETKLKTAKDTKAS